MLQLYARTLKSSVTLTELILSPQILYRFKDMGLTSGTVLFFLIHSSKTVYLILANYTILDIVDLGDSYSNHKFDTDLEVWASQVVKSQNTSSTSKNIFFENS